LCSKVADGTAHPLRYFLKKACFYIFSLPFAGPRTASEEPADLYGLSNVIKAEKNMELCGICFPSLKN